MENLKRKQLHGKNFFYSTELYPFLETIENFMGCSISTLHTQLGHFDTFKRVNDQNTLAHKVFYANFDTHLKKIYTDFMHSFIAPIVGEPFYFQKRPTFRIGLPGNKFVGEFHKDSFYNHQSYELNFNLGLTNYCGDAGLQVETEEGSEEFETLESPYGTVFSFDHIDCLHGSKLNPFKETVVSFDFRIALASLFYENEDAKTLNTNMLFKPGAYFSQELVK